MLMYIAVQKIQLIFGRRAAHHLFMNSLGPCAGARSRSGRRHGNPSKELPLNVHS